MALREKHIASGFGGGSVRSRSLRVPVIVAFVALTTLGVAGVAALYSLSTAANPAPADRGRTSSPGAQSARGPGENAVTVLVTRDFGGRVLASGSADASAGSVMDALKRVANVETAYGGGFVNSIDGLASGYTGGGGERADWFYHVDGLLADRGAADYRLEGAERVWWDYHSWEFAASVPAVVGQYPAPFVAGGVDGTRRATLVAYAAGFDADARSVADTLRTRGADVRVEPIGNDVPAAADTHVVLIGTWSRLARLTTLTPLVSAPSASGLFASFSTSGTLAYDAAGTARPTPASGAVLATARADAPGTALWLLTGSAGPDVRAACRVLTERSAELSGHYGVLVERDGTVSALPREARR